MNKEIITFIECPLGGEGAGEYLKKQMDIIDQSLPGTKPLIQANSIYGQTVKGHDPTKFHFYTKDSALIRHKIVNECLISYEIFGNISLPCLPYFYACMDPLTSRLLKLKAKIL